MNFCVFGAGAWGTAMALHMVARGHAVTLVPRRIDQAMKLASTRENTDYLPGYKLPLNLQLGFEVKPVLMEADVAILACGKQELRNMCESISQYRESSHALKLVITLVKGSDGDTNLSVNEVVDDVLPDLDHAVLSGPENAAELASGKATDLTLESDRESRFISQVQAALSDQGL